MFNYTISYNLNDERILSFLSRDENSSIYHHPSWLKAISKSFHHKSFYVFIENERNELIGLVPFIKINSLIEGKEIVSVPFSAYCQLLVPKELISDLTKFLRNKFRNPYRIKFKTFGDIKEFLTEFSHCPAYFIQRLNLSDNLQDVFNSFHPRSIRGSIRRANQKDTTVTSSSLESELKIFYNLEFTLRKKLYLPVLPYVFFKNIFYELSKQGLIKIYIVRIDSVPIAAALVLIFKKTYYIEYAASDKNYINLYPNHKLYWKIIQDASMDGVKTVDFGRTTFDNEPLAIFKEKWGAKRNTVYSSNFPPFQFNSVNRYKLKNKLVKINSHLPDWLLKTEGNVLYRHLD